MQRWRKRAVGVTFTEVLVVIAIIATLAAISYPLTAGVREKAKQSRCASQLRQFHQAFTLYGADNPGYEPLHTSVDVPAVAMRNPFLLMEYLKDRQLYYCPDTPECAKPWLASNYSFNGLPRPGTPTRGRAIAHFQRIMDLEGSNYPIMTCMAHDEMYYFPRESDLSPEFNPPFVIDLLADGAIRAKRRKLQRTFDLRHHCQLGERK